MNWFYADGGRQVGPVDQAALDELFRQGVVRDDTLVWRDGMAAWQPYGTVRPRPAAPPPPPPPQYSAPQYSAPPGSEMRYCAECGRGFPAHELSMVGNVAVCASCRPIVMQRANVPSPAYGYTPPPGAGGYAPPAAAAGVFDYALWPTRVFAALIDFGFVLIVLIALYVIGFVFFGSMIGLSSGIESGGLGGASVWGCCCYLSLIPLSTLLVGLYNKVYLVSNRGFSIGQGMMKIKVVNAQGGLLTGGTAFLRLLVQSGLGLIFILTIVDLLWPLWDERRQTLHDKAVNSYVVNNPSGV